MKGTYYILLALIISCSFPKDTKNSFSNARESGLLVGVVNNPPYTTYANSATGGTEVTIIQEFADKEGLPVHYTRGTESLLVKKLENHELHLVIGGFDKNTVWKDKAGISTTYNDKNVILVAPGENQLLYRLEAVLLKHKQNGN